VASASHNGRLSSIEVGVDAPGEEAAPRRARVFSWGLKRNRILKKTSGLTLSNSLSHRRSPCDVSVGWGRKASGLAAQKYALENYTEILLLEDGFIRSAGREDLPVSLVMDDLGIYYDATQPSRLEVLCKKPRDLAEITRARRIRQAWVEEGVSKYNDGRQPSICLPDDYVLVVDQVAGDCSITYGCASAKSFRDMLDAALQENPDSQIVLKVHPDQVSRKKSGHFDLVEISKNPRITVIAEPVHPVDLIRGAQCVYTVTSQVGFEALLHGRPVRCFGMPFYAGWGLTADDLKRPSRRCDIDLEALVYAALVDYSAYVDPVLDEVMQIEDAIAYMGAVRMQIDKTPEVIHALGFSLWKKPILRRFCRHSRVVFCRARQVPHGATVALWGRGIPEDLPKSVSLVRIEDGFLRSRGLGADLTQPYSWCFDKSGIHFDPSRPSDLEHILAHGHFSEHFKARAAGLREKIVSSGLSKYNLTEAPWRRSTSQRTILVAGQVEDDASIAAGTTEVCSNADLLKAARKAEPDAWLIYKPHPDVVSGLRVADENPDLIDEIADEIVRDVSSIDLLSQVDGLHVMTSQIGFEAILRNVSVTCHGIPFYKGWGLTNESQPIERRSRSLTIDELVAASLIFYPSYSDPKSGLLMTPEQTIELLSRGRERSRNTVHIRGLRKFWARLRHRGTKVQHDEDREDSFRQQA